MAKQGIRFNIKTTPDLDQIAAAFRPSRAKKIDGWLGTLSKVVHKKIVEEAPKKTGELRRAIVRKRVKQFNYGITVDRRFKGGKYEPFVRLGTRPHLILPRRKKALWWPGLPHPVGYANHPGTKPNNYWDRGLNKSESDIRAAEQAIANDIERELIKT